MNLILLSFILSAFFSFVVIRLCTKNYLKCSTDSELNGAQKFHHKEVPRIGGMPILLSMMGVGVYFWFENPHDLRLYLYLFLASLPAFLAGLVEDTTKKVSVKQRLILTMASGAIAFYLLGNGIVRFDIPSVDQLLKISAVSLLVTVFLVSGITNAINIIDGFNGLASMVLIIIFGAIAIVSYQVDDSFLLSCSLIFIGSIIGFWIFNFPYGHIFLGDGGAYLLGFLASQLCMFLVLRNESVSAWFPALLLIYPVFETIFSIYRKKFLRGTSPGVPDGLHLHMLVYKRMTNWMLKPTSPNFKVYRNAFTSPYLWIIQLVAAIPAILFWDSMFYLCLALLISINAYLYLYKSIVHFKSSRLILFKKKQPVQFPAYNNRSLELNKSSLSIVSHNSRHRKVWVIHKKLRQRSKVS